MVAAGFSVPLAAVSRSACIQNDGGGGGGVGNAVGVNKFCVVVDDEAAFGIKPFDIYAGNADGDALIIGQDRVRNSRDDAECVSVAGFVIRPCVYLVIQI
jgi:hypothetical protein